MHSRWLAILLFLVIHSIEAIAQSTESALENAYSLYENKQFAESALLYEKAFAADKAIPGHEYYNAACSFALAGNSKKALFYLEQCFRKPRQDGSQWMSASHLATDTDIDLIRDLPEFNALIKKFYRVGDAEFATNKEISFDNLTDYINARIKEGQTEIEIRDKVVFWKKDSTGFVVNPRSTFFSSRITDSENANIKFINCTFEFNVLIGKTREEFTIGFISFENCQFKHDLLIFKLNLNRPLSLRKCSINGAYILTNIVNSIREDTGKPNITIDSCTISSARFTIDAYSNSPIDIYLTGNTMADSTWITITGNSVANLDVRNNRGPKAFLRIQSDEIGSLNIDGNSFESISLFNSQITSKFNFRETSIATHFYLGNSSFNENPTNQLRWGSFGNHKLAMLKQFKFVAYDDVLNRPVYAPVFSDGKKEQDFESEDDFASLMGTYSLFLNQYKSNNDLESYNKCFIAIKELQSKRLQYLYKAHGGFEPYFRWKLSQLLKFYVRYGTDPGRAIVISIYIILVFGVFFFFFPSDWDVTSKGMLIQNYRDFIEKNEKGYIKPFLQLVKGLIISLVNAVTLSLNAFITLGFGNIPTHGIARYFCVLEGFLGWFLLSIFTVALINQTL